MEIEYLIHIFIHFFHKFILHVHFTSSQCDIIAWIEIKVELIFLTFLCKSQCKHLCVDCMEFQSWSECSKCNLILEVDERAVPYIQVRSVVFPYISNVHFDICYDLFHFLAVCIQSGLCVEYAELSIHKSHVLEWLSLGFKPRGDRYVLEIFHVFTNVVSYQNFNVSGHLVVDVLPCVWFVTWFEFSRLFGECFVPVHVVYFLVSLFFAIRCCIEFSGFGFFISYFFIFIFINFKSIRIIFFFLFFILAELIMLILIF